MIEDDLDWLGLNWDEGGVDASGNAGPYRQSLRDHFYKDALKRLEDTGRCYRCHCSRADIMATQAPHQSDGRVVYAGTCRPAPQPPFAPGSNDGAVRLWVPDREITFTDRLYGAQSVNLAKHCGDFVLRRADGAWAYQLAVVVDDAMMGVTEVVRGCDLLLSSAQQIYLYNLLGGEAPDYGHIPLLCNADGLRLSKRDKSLSMAELRVRHTPGEIIGLLAWQAGLIPQFASVPPADLVPLFNWNRLPASEKLLASIPAS